MTQSLSNPPLLRGHYAGFVSRAVALILDLLIVTAIEFTVVVVTRLLLNFLGLSAFWSSVDPGVTIPGRRITTWITTLLGGLFFFGLYSAFFWTLIDKTLGQALLGLRVLRTNGQSLTFRWSVIRAVGYFLAAIPLFLGFLWVLVDDRRQGWHDKLADTVVVYDWDARLGKQIREWLARQQSPSRTPAPPIEPPPNRESTYTADPVAEPQRPSTV